MCSTPFEVHVSAPSECPLQSLLEVVVSVKSLQATNERVRVNVVVSENFLLAGPTLTVLEVSHLPFLHIPEILYC